MSISLNDCPRERLGSMRVRLLSREERLNYLTTVDEQGRLCCKKNGIKIDTSIKWQDSIAGTIPVDDPMPAFASTGDMAQVPTDPSNGSDNEADSDRGLPQPHVGIKQSSTFQHSSFRRGSHVSSAGLIKIRDCKIKLLQPRSGHYHPPASIFLGFPACAACAWGLCWRRGSRRAMLLWWVRKGI